MPRKKDNLPATYNDAFPTRLRTIMQKTNTTQQTLADVIDKTRQAISYYMDGSSSPDWKTIAAISKYFNVSADYLLGLTENMSPDVGIKSVCASTPLTENAAKALMTLDSPCSIALINTLLEASSGLLEKLAKKYIAYTYAKNVIKPTAEKYVDELNEHDIYADIYVIDGQAMPHVKIQDTFDYARFELWRAFGEFFEM